MRVLLLDLDRNGFPNLALMKLSAWHKALGHEVFLNQAASWDTCYASSVFTINVKPEKVPPHAIIGGTGFNKVRFPTTIHWDHLPPYIEETMPDYQLYGGLTSIGFTSRGCNRRCPWCIVPEKEGKIKPWADIYQFWDRRYDRICLLDNNILQSPNWRSTMECLIKEKVLVDFNQGLDIRLVTDEVAWYLKRVKRYTKLRFSFDRWKYYRKVQEGITLLSQVGIKPSALHFYVLMGYEQNAEEDYARLELLRDYGCSIFPMIYIDEDGIIHPPAPGKIPKDMHGSRPPLRKLARLKGVVK